MKKIALFCLTLIFLTVACATYPIPTSVAPTMRPTISPTKQIGDCGWQGNVQAWNDQNANGVWDTGEQSLENVAFFLYDFFSSLTDGKYGISGSDGKAELYLFMPGCPSVTLLVYAEAPANYKPTTPNRIESPEYNANLKFGFQYTGATAPTPRPAASLTCQSYSPRWDRNYSYSIITDMAVETNGTVWVGNGNGNIVRIDPRAQTVTKFSTQDGLPKGGIRTIAVTSNGIVWVGTDRGLVRYDGSNWEQDNAISKNRYTFDYTRSIAIDQASDVWVAHGGIASRFNQKTKSWEME